MRTQLTTFFLFLLFTFLCFDVNAQSNSDSGVQATEFITISSSGEALVPADFAVLSVNISVTNPDAERAFELHKERESFLASLLTELNLSDDKISYQPISIRPNRQRDGAVHSATSQSVRFELEDFDQLSELQILLISNEFDNFSGSFASSQMEQAGSEALKQAVENAKSDAEILTQASGKTLGEVIWIEHSSDGRYRPAMASEGIQLRSADFGPSLGDFSQTITVQKRIEIRFRILDE